MTLAFEVIGYIQIAYFFHFLYTSKIFPFDSTYSYINVLERALFNIVYVLLFQFVDVVCIMYVLSKFVLIQCTIPLFVSFSSVISKFAINLHKLTGIGNYEK